MHPADQFDAFFQLLTERGLSAEDIVDVTLIVVKLRFKLATVSPRLMQAYRDAKLTVDQLSAFAVIGTGSSYLYATATQEPYQCT